MAKNPVSLDTLCGALAYSMGIEPPKYSADKNSDLANYVDTVLEGGKVDRVFMYNPDAIAQWIQEKYPELLGQVAKHTELSISYNSVFPPKTPVCFGTMYTGAQPEVHGIQKYEKPIIRIDSLFDALIRAGKKPVILAAEPDCSLARIYLERDMDYFFYDTIEEVNAKTKGSAGITKLSADDSKVQIYMIPTNEELVIASDTEQIVSAL